MYTSMLVFYGLEMNANMHFREAGCSTTNLARNCPSIASPCLCAFQQAAVQCHTRSLLGTMRPRITLSRVLHHPGPSISMQVILPEVFNDLHDIRLLLAYYNLT